MITGSLSPAPSGRYKSVESFTPSRMGIITLFSLRTLYFASGIGNRGFGSCPFAENRQPNVQRAKTQSFFFVYDTQVLCLGTLIIRVANLHRNLRRHAKAHPLSKSM